MSWGSTRMQSDNLKLTNGPAPDVLCEDNSRQTMAKAGQTSLEAITAALGHAGKAPPPVERWNPPFCGDLDMRIAADGTWFYLKTPIGRPALVKLFASVLKREGNRYFLVTPVEKCGIRVDDAPFLAVELNVERVDGGQMLNFRTNVDDWVACGPQHRLRFEPEAEPAGSNPISTSAATCGRK